MEKGFRHNQKVAILVDNENIVINNEIGIEVDYRRLLEVLKDHPITRAIFYFIEKENNSFTETDFIKKIKMSGFEVKTKRLKKYNDGNQKGNMDIEITIDAVCLADKVDVIVIASCNEDYVPLVNYLKSRGVKVEAMTFKSEISKDLRKAVDHYWPIEEIFNHTERKLCNQPAIRYEPRKGAWTLQPIDGKAVIN
jgi:uncharacterized LabA/DUF88 family protein